MTSCVSLIETTVCDVMITNEQARYLMSHSWLTGWSASYAKTASYYSDRDFYVGGIQCFRCKTILDFYFLYFNLLKFSVLLLCPSVGTSVSRTGDYHVEIF